MLLLTSPLPPADSRGRGPRPLRAAQPESQAQAPDRRIAARSWHSGAGCRKNVQAMLLQRPDRRQATGCPGRRGVADARAC